MGIEFKAGEYTQKTEKIINEICSVLENNGKSEDADALRKYKSKIEEEEKIKVAFVGRYSSGKSSIISALTGNNHIQIGSDVTTQEENSYEWGSFILVDTPGLHNNEKHDEAASEAIKTSDLIVYCITSELFTNNTRDDFLNLAFEKNYASKMILLINKLNMEASEDKDAQIENYVKSINSSLVPHSLDDVEHCFIDVLDYMKGIEKNRPGRIEKSRFETFINLLNDLIKEKGLMCKLLTPIKAAEEVLEKVWVEEAESPAEEAGRNTVSRIKTVIKNYRAKADREWDRIIIRNTLDYSNEAFNLYDRASRDKSVNTDAEIERILNDTYNNIIRELEEYVVSVQGAVDDEMEEISSSKQAQFFINELKESAAINIGNHEEHKGSGVFKSLYGATKDTVKEGVKKVSKESIKDAVKKIAKTINYKFDPWEATKIANKISDGLKWLGPAMDAIGIVIDVAETVSENKQAQKAVQARRELRKAIDENGRRIKGDFDESKTQFMEEVFNAPLESLQEYEDNVLKAKKGKKDYNEKISEFKKQLEQMNKEILSKT